MTFESLYDLGYIPSLRTLRSSGCRGEYKGGVIGDPD